MKDDDALADIEMHLFIDGIFRRYGFDFRNYAQTSFRRRIAEFMRREDFETISACQHAVLLDAACMERLLLTIFVHVSTLFRDAAFYRALQRDVIPRLRTYPFIRIWHAGCASGEEVYSMAILLEEAGLTERVRIYATDISEAVVERAKAGIYPLAKLEEFGRNYKHAGGSRCFEDYYAAGHDRIIMASRLRKNIIWAQHGLATDGSFNECHLILCRNVMIYFDETLQTRVHTLLHDSLVMHGILGLGQRESIRSKSHQSCYKPVTSTARLYQKVQ